MIIYQTLNKPDRTTCRLPRTGDRMPRPSADHTQPANEGLGYPICRFVAAAFYCKDAKEPTPNTFRPAQRGTARPARRGTAITGLRRCSWSTTREVKPLLRPNLAITSVERVAPIR